MTGFIVFVIFVISFITYGVHSLNNFADINCGQRSQRNARIVGGEEATKAEFPWLVSITRRGNHFCGGTLINKKYVLTAGHCICTGSGSNDYLTASNVKVTVSQHDLTKENSEAYQVSLKSITVHPEYSCNKVKNDIAILELEKGVSWSQSVTPACLPTESTQKSYSTFDNILATVAGWGWTSEERDKGGRATTLRKAKVQVIEIEKCKAWFKSQNKKTKIQETQMCAGHEQGGIDACWADSGGPLMIETETKDKMMVVGVVSTGIGCARPYLPGIYTRVSEYIPWIREVIGK